MADDAEMCRPDVQAGRAGLSLPSDPHTSFDGPDAALRRPAGRVKRPGFDAAFFLVKGCVYTQETPAGGS